MKKWPVFKQTIDARCFNCDKTLMPARHTGFVRGSGQYKGWCPSCHMFTWFDVEQVPSVDKWPMPKTGWEK